MSESSYLSQLPQGRLEERFEPQKSGLDDVEACVEASRCLFCYDAPCAQACPASIDVAGFIWDIHSGNLRGAARNILSQNVLGLACAMVCPVPEQCEGACVLQHAGRPPVAISKLQRYAVEKLYESEKPLFEKGEPTGKKVALVGAGPASLACAHELTLRGHQCTLFEKRDLPGGLGTYAMAPYKWTTDASLREVEWMSQVGFEVRCGVEVGSDIAVEKLLEDYDALFMGVGLGDDTPMMLKTENSGDLPEGVVGALDLIEAIKLKPATEVEAMLEGVNDAIVIGGGSTAMDAACELAKLGVPNVTVLYRRDEEHMPSFRHERALALHAGAKIRFLQVPVAWIADDEGRLKGAKVARTELGERSKHGRRMVTTIEDDVHQIDVQLAVVAIGQRKPADMMPHVQDISYDKKGCVVVSDDSGRTTNPKIYAGGDCVNGGWELVNAVAAGREAAKGIDELLKEGESS